MVIVIVIRKVSWHLIVYLAFALGAATATNHGSRSEVPTVPDRSEVQRCTGPLIDHWVVVAKRKKPTWTHHRTVKASGRARCGCTGPQR